MLRIKLQELAKLHADLTARDAKWNATSNELQLARSKLMARDSQVAAYEQKLQKLLADQVKQSKNLSPSALSALHDKNEELIAAHAALSMTEAKLNHTSAALDLSEHERERLEVLEQNLSTTLDKQGTVLHTVASNFSRVLKDLSALKREEAQLQAEDHSLTARLGDRVRELNVMHSALRDVSVSLAKSEARGQQLNRTLATNSMLYDKVHMGLAAAEKRAHHLLEELKMLRKTKSQLEAANANLTNELSSQGTDLGASLVRDKQLSREATTLTQQLSNRSNELLAALSHVHKLRTLNKHLKQATRKLKIAVATMGKEVVRTRSAADKALAESQQSKLKLATVKIKDARLRKNLKKLRSQLSRAVANTTVALVVNDKLMKELHADQYELNDTRVMLKAAQKLAKDLARNSGPLGAQSRNQSTLGLVTSKQGESKKLARLKKEVVKIHTLLNRDERLLRRYRQSQKRLRARLEQLPHQNGTIQASGEEHQLALVRDERNRLTDQNRALLTIVKQLRAKLGQDGGMTEGAEVEGQSDAYTP